MFRYNYRLLDHHGRMPVSVAVLGDDRRAWRPAAHAAGRWGCEGRFADPTAKLLDHAGREAELAADPNPFAAVTLTHLKTIETRADPDTRRERRFRLVRGLYDRGYDRQQVQHLFLVMDRTLRPPPQRLRFDRDLAAFEEERQVQLLSPSRQAWK